MYDGLRICGRVKVLYVRFEIVDDERRKVRSASNLVIISVVICETATLTDWRCKIYV